MQLIRFLCCILGVMDSNSGNMSTCDCGFKDTDVFDNSKNYLKLIFKFFILLSTFDKFM